MRARYPSGKSASRQGGWGGLRRNHEEKRAVAVLACLHVLDGHVHFRIGLVPWHDKALGCVAIVVGGFVLRVDVVRGPETEPEAPGPWWHEIRLRILAQVGFPRALPRLTVLRLPHPELAAALHLSGCQMPFADESRVVACVVKRVGEPVLPRVALHVVRHDARVGGIASGHQHAPVRRAERTARDGVGEGHAFRGQTVDAGCGDVRAAVEPKIAGAQLVVEDEDEVRPASGGSRVAGGPGVQRATGAQHARAQQASALGQELPTGRLVAHESVPGAESFRGGG